MQNEEYVIAQQVIAEGQSSLVVKALEESIEELRGEIDFLKEENHRAEAKQETIRGKMTFDDAVVIYRQQLKDAPHLKPSAKVYREKCIKALLKSWAASKEQPPGKSWRAISRKMGVSVGTVFAAGQSHNNKESECLVGAAAGD